MSEKKLIDIVFFSFFLHFINFYVTTTILGKADTISITVHGNATQRVIIIAGNMFCFLVLVSW